MQNFFQNNSPLTNKKKVLRGAIGTKASKLLYWSGGQTSFTPTAYFYLSQLCNASIAAACASSGLNNEHLFRVIYIFVSHSARSNYYQSAGVVKMIWYGQDLETLLHNLLKISSLNRRDHRSIYALSLWGCSIVLTQIGSHEAHDGWKGKVYGTSCRCIPVVELLNA